MMVDGNGLRVRVNHGPGEQAFLLIHGMGGGLSNWLPLERRLAGLAPTVAVELPWHGRSRSRKPCRSADDIVELVAEAAFAAWPGGFVAVGHSLGGSIAMGLAALTPDRVKHVVLVSGHLFTLNDLIAGRTRSEAGLRIALWRALMTASTPMPRPARAMFTRSAWLRRRLLPPFFNPALLGAGDGAFGDCLEDHNGFGAWRIYRLSRSVSLEDVARGCPAPVTIVQGGRDPLVRPSDIERAHQLLRVSRHHLLADCAHWPIVERPDEIARLLLALPR